MPEEKYYSELENYISEELRSNLGSNFEVFSAICGSGNFKTKLGELLRDYNQLNTPFFREFYDNALNLKVDLFFIIKEANSEAFTLLIVEVKARQSVGLVEYAQLIGYCLVLDCPFGLLINVDGNVSDEFAFTLRVKPELTRILRVLPAGEQLQTFGVMLWKHSVQRLDYTELGYIKSIPDLCKAIKQKVKTTLVSE